MNKKNKIITVIIIILIVTVFSVIKLKSKPLTTVYPGEKDILQSIAATGRIYPVKETIISSEITGIVNKIPKDKGATVSKGETVLTLKDAQYMAEVEQAEGNLSSAEANLEKILRGTEEEIIETSKANLAATEAKLSGAKKDLNISETYNKRNTELEEKLSSAISNRDSAKSRVDLLKAKYEDLLNGPRHEEIERAKASVEKAKVNLSQGKSDLERGERLYNDGVIPKQQYEIAQTNYKNSQKSLEEWEANLNLLLNSPTKEEIEQAEAALQEGKAILKGAEENLKITKEACKDNLKSLEQLNNSKTGYNVALQNKKAGEKELQRLIKQPLSEDIKVAEGKVKEARAALKGAKAHMNFTVLVSPIDGVILEKSVNPGQGITPGTALLRIASKRELEVRVNFDEKKLSSIKTGQTAYVNLDAYPDITLEGKIHEIAPSINSGTGTVEIKIKLLEIPDYIKPDMTADTNIIIYKKNKCLTVPRSCVFKENNKKYVFILNRGKQEKREVITGAAGSDYIEIREGIKLTDQVIIKEQR